MTAKMILKHKREERRMQVAAIATRSGGRWVAEVPELPGLFTQVRRLDQVPEAVSDAARLLTDKDVDLAVKAKLADDLQLTIEGGPCRNI